MRSLEHPAQLRTEHQAQSHGRDEHCVQCSSWLQENPKGQILQEIAEAATHVFVD